jgi:hypothetical protein
MELSQVFSALVGACFGALGWLFVGLYINRRTAVATARSATRAVFFELELNRANIELAETYGELLPLSRSAYEQLLPQLANLLAPADLATVASAYMSHIGYEQLRQSHEQPEEARSAALAGILTAQRLAIARLRSVAFTPAEQAQLSRGGFDGRPSGPDTEVRAGAE